MELSTVVPVYNEVESVSALSEEAHAALKGRLDFELLFVDDGTAEVLAALAAQSPRLRVLHHCGNAGQSASLLTGGRAARAERLATLDGDGQNDPADLLRRWALRD